jgi:solute carrier family 6 amino acid transporter-like protein 5/7/9/14
MMVLAGFPLMFMELAFGQYASLSPVVIFERFCPLFGGIGYGMVIVSAIVMLYYNMIIAWTIYYMFVSINKQLPWEKCEPEWRTPLCYSHKEKDECIRLHPNGAYFNQTCIDTVNSTLLKFIENSKSMEKRTSADEFFT